MSPFKPLFIFTALLTSSLGFSQFTDVINSNRPGESQAAFSVGRTVIQAEFGVTGIREDHFVDNYEAKGFNYDLAVRYGAFFEQLEFMLGAQYSYEDYSEPGVYIKDQGFKKINLGAKFLVYDPYKNYEEKKNLYSWKANHKFSWRQFIPAVGVYAGVNVDLATTKFLRPGYPKPQNTSLKGMILTQNQFGKFVLVGNIIMDQFPKYPSIDYVVTLTRGFNQYWSGFIEIQGFNNDYYKDNIFRGGAAYLIAQNIQVDAALGTNVKNTPTLQNATVGLSWRFDENYNDVYLRIPKEKKSKEDKKKDKKKEKDKKRLDAIENGEKTK